MPENRMSSPLRGARPRLRRVGVLVAALALLSTPLASGVAAADSNRATALKGLLAEMPGTVDAASSGTLNLKRLLTYSRNAEQREFTRKVLTENGFDGAYIRFSSTDDVGYTQYAFSLRDARAARDTQKRLSRFDPELSHYKPFLVGEVPGAFGYTYVETKPIDGGNPCNAQEIVFSAGRDYFEVGGCSDKSRGDTGDLRAFANAQYCLAAGASGGEHCLVDFDAETNGLASSALDLKQAASFVGNQRFLSTHGYLGGTYAAGTLTEGGVEILIALAFKTPGAASAFQQLVEKSARSDPSVQQQQLRGVPTGVLDDGGTSTPPPPPGETSAPPCANQASSFVRGSVFYYLTLCTTTPQPDTARIEALTREQLCYATRKPGESCVQDG